MQKRVVALMLSLLVFSGVALNASAVTQTAHLGDTGISYPTASLYTRSIGGDPTSPANLPPEQISEPDAWPMAAANPERTSWTPEEVGGYLKPLWYKPFEPYIPQRAQIIAAHHTLYICGRIGSKTARH
jgi:hypothetical protein